MTGGPRPADVCEVLGELERTRTVVGVSFTAWDLAADRRRTTEAACLAALRALTG